MCIAAPYRVIEVTGSDRALIDINGIKQEISTLMVPEVQAGDYVMAYLGSALAIVEEKEAEEAIRLFREMAETETPRDVYSTPDRI